MTSVIINPYWFFKLKNQSHHMNSLKSICLMVANINHSRLVVSKWQNLTHSETRTKLHLYILHAILKSSQSHQVTLGHDSPNNVKRHLTDATERILPIVRS